MIGPWIAETQAKKVTAQAETRSATGRRQMSPDDIAAIVAALGDLARVIADADPADKAELYAQLKLALTYQPSQRVVEATVEIGANMPKGFVSEGGLEPPCRGSFPRAVKSPAACSSAAKTGERSPASVPERGPDPAFR